MSLRHLAMTAAIAAVASVAVAAPAVAAPVTLTGTVGPGFTITLTKSGKKVTTLVHGTYKLVVNDKAAIHDFHLSGPGYSKVLTSVSFVGSKTFTVTLKKGTYHYQCDPHRTLMKGSFTVT